MRGLRNCNEKSAWEMVDDEEIYQDLQMNKKSNKISDQERLLLG